MLFHTASKLVVAGSIALAAAFPQPGPTINVADYAAHDVIYRDVAMIGGGSTGTYAAVHLRDLGKSVVVVEKKNRLGGHTETYTDPVSGNREDIGVVVFHTLPIVQDYFARYNISLIKADLGSAGTTDVVDYRTGKIDKNYIPTDPTAGLGAYGALISQYPYVEAGFDLPDPVPADLLLPFGQFITKYKLEGLAQFLFAFAQGLGDLFAQPTLYVFKNFGLGILQDLQIGFLTTKLHDNNLLYEAATADLAQDVLLSTHVIATDRSCADSVKVLVKTPTGHKLIVAKKLVLTIPPKLANLHGFDLSHAETSLFSQFQNSGYYTALVRNTGIPPGTSINNVGDGTQYSVPVLPGIYSISPTAIPDVFDVKYGSATALSSEVVKADILASVKRLQTAGTVPTTTGPEFVIFSNHSPFELTVPAAAIKAGFYKKLYGLQGQRNTFYTGAAFHTHDSSLLWQFTAALLPRIAA